MESRDGRGETGGAAEEGVVHAPFAGHFPAFVRGTFESLRYRDFLLLWAGGWFSNTGIWIQAIALNWLVYTLTSSPLALGIVQFSSSIPVFFLSPFAGALADRIDKRRLLVVANSFSMACAIVLGGLVGGEVVSVGSVVAITLLSGTVMAFSFPTWQAIIADLVPRKSLTNAIGLNSVQFHAARLIGPALAGVIAASVGLAWNFYVNAVTYVAILGSLLLIRAGGRRAGGGAGGSPLGDMRDGVRYAWRHRDILFYLLDIGVISFFGISFYTVLLPVFARDLLHMGVKGYGLLMSFNGMGALAGALVVAWISGRVRPRAILGVTVPLVGGAVMLFACSTSLPLALACMFAMGFLFLTSTTTINTGIQTAVENRYRGRVMSIFVWMFLGTAPFASLLAGFLGSAVGARHAVASGAAVVLLLGIVINARLLLRSGRK